jgi:hypothetical protein
MQSSSLPVFAFARSFIDGNRVALFGAGSKEAIASCTQFGARLAIAFDPDVSEAYDSLRPVPATVRPLRDEELDVRPGAFDVVFLLDVASLPSLHKMLPRLRKALNTTGALFARAELGEGRYTYEELYDFFSLHFEHVKMLGVMPFEGVSFVELGKEDPDVSVNTEFAEAEPPSQFLICASAEPIETDGYAIVATEARISAPVALAASESLVSPSVAAAALLQSAAAQEERDAEYKAVSTKAEMLESALDDMRTRLANAESSVGGRASELEAQVSDRERRLAASEDRAREYATQAQRLGIQVEHQRDELTKREREARELTQLLEQAQQVPAAPVPVPVPVAVPVPVDLARYEHEQLDNAQAIAMLTEELAAAEAIQAERTAHVKMQEREIRRLHALVRELVLAQEINAANRLPDPTLEAKLDALAQALAVAQSEIEVGKWDSLKLEVFVPKRSAASS